MRWPTQQLTTGGTGFTGRDVTPEAVEPLFEKRMDGFSTLFLMVSYGKIGTSAIQTRATAGDAAPARMRLDDQQARLGDALAGSDQHHGARGRAIKLGDPAALAGEVVAALEIRDDPGHQHGKLRSPPVFPAVDCSMAREHPAE